MEKSNVLPWSLWFCLSASGQWPLRRASFSRARFLHVRSVLSVASLKSNLHGKRTQHFLFSLSERCCLQLLAFCFCNLAKITLVWCLLRSKCILLKKFQIFQTPSKKSRTRTVLKIKEKEPSKRNGNTMLDSLRQLVYKCTWNDKGLLYVW